MTCPDAHHETRRARLPSRNTSPRGASGCSRRHRPRSGCGAAVASALGCPYPALSTRSVPAPKPGRDGASMPRSWSSTVDLHGCRCVGRVLSEGSFRLRNMSSNGEAALVTRLRADLYALVAVDVAAMPDATLRSELVELLAAANQLNAAIASRIASFDTRGLSDDDGCQTTKVWLRCNGRSSDATAARLVHQARLLRDLPAVAEAAGRGAVTADHVGQI